ncbi:hypothetical protein L1049_020081 [Liquidambar formosana]|uniref:Uncharacterized protein n=1 Tax=Liquidambar formosana TaxID=63359 RepID=A0AAP0S9A8_LIQFO
MTGETNGSGQTSIEIRELDHQLVSSIRRKLPNSPPLRSQSCIFRVPVSIRRSNQKAYLPNVVSIGPFHRGKRNLKSMERVKLWFLHCLLNRSPTPEKVLDCFVKNIRDMERYCREYYAEKISLSSDEFVEMMVVDGCFIIELFRKCCAQEVQEVEVDPGCNLSLMTFDLAYDLLLFENQLPWPVLECLWDLTVGQDQRGTSLLRCFALSFFCPVIPMISEDPLGIKLPIKHLLDFMRNILVPSAAPDTETNEDRNWHLLDFMRNILVPSAAPDTETNEDRNWLPIPCVTELLQAGVKFKVGNKKDLLDIKFNNGVMEIPPILIQEGAECLFRNLVAFEQCDRSCTDKFASYAILLDNLINSTKDVDFLCHEGIIETYFSHEDLASIFFRLCSRTVITDFSYAELSRKVNAYYKARWPKWQATLRRDYFNNPWSILSFLAAILILFFTFAQTLFSVLSYQDSLARP